MPRHDVALTRRAVLGTGALLTLGLMSPAHALPLPDVTVNKTPNCGCCEGWAAHLRSAGFSVTVIEQPDMRAVRARLGVPENLAACHTAEVAEYVLEGHVPAPAAIRLLTEKPQGRGLAVTGMPSGSPGMEGGEPDRYEVMLFGSQPARTFAIYRGSQLLQNL